MSVTPRIERYVSAMYSDEGANLALDLLGSWRISHMAEPPSERLMAAALVRADGDLDDLAEELDLGEIDFRDLLMHTGLEHDDWPEVFAAVFGPP